MESVEKDRTNPTALFEYTAFHLLQDELQDAVHLFAKGVELFHIGLGRAYKKLNQYENMFDAYKQAIDINDIYPEPYIQIGNILRQQESFEDAVSVYMRSIERFPQNSDLYFGLGDVHRILGNYDEAVVALRLTIELRPSMGIAYHRLGLSYKAQGNLEQARLIYEEGMEKLLPKDNYTVKVR